MSNLENALKNYTSVTKQLDEFRKEHADVFKKLDDLNLKLQDAEAKLKDEVQMARQNVANERVKVTFSPVFKKGYDGRKVMELVKPALRQKLIDEGIVKYEVDREAFVKAVDRGDVPVEVQQNAYIEEERNPRIIIRVKPQEDEE